MCASWSKRAKWTGGAGAAAFGKAGRQGALPAQRQGQGPAADRIQHPGRTGRHSGPYPLKTCYLLESASITKTEILLKTRKADETGNRIFDPRLGRAPPHGSAGFVIARADAPGGRPRQRR